jgi:hypothetical protein
MSKRIGLTLAKPASSALESAEEWITSRHGADKEKPIESAPAPEPTRRLTFDLALSLHRRLKIGAAKKDKNVADFLRDIIERECPAEDAAKP